MGQSPDADQVGSGNGKADESFTHLSDEELLSFEQELDEAEKRRVGP